MGLVLVLVKASFSFSVLGANLAFPSYTAHGLRRQAYHLAFASSGDVLRVNGGRPLD